MLNQIKKNNTFDLNNDLVLLISKVLVWYIGMLVLKSLCFKKKRNSVGLKILDSKENKKLKQKKNSRETAFQKKIRRAINCLHYTFLHFIHTCILLASPIALCIDVFLWVC